MDNDFLKSASLKNLHIMKRILLLVFLSVFSLSTIHAEITWDLSDDGTLTISGTEMGDGNLYGHNRPWIYNSQKIKKIVIEDGVKNIGAYAFAESSNLVSVIIPKTVTSIGEYAFYKCPNLTNISIPNSVEFIGQYAFYGCSALATSITIPNSVVFISPYTFYGCTNIPSVYLPNSVTTIGEAAFAGCGSLTSFTFPNSVTTIDREALKDCSNIREIYSWNITPPTLSDGNYSFPAFGGLNVQHIKVYVPEGSAETYKYAFGWKTFANIYEMSFSPIHSEAEPITVSDGAPTVTKGYYKENTVTYVREGAAISKDNYASFCLPFAVDPADAQFKAVYVPVGIALYNTETNTLRVGFYKAKDIIPAGTPFLARLDVDDKVEIKNALPVNYDANTPAIKTKTIRTFDFYERSGIMSENDSYSITFSGSYKKASPANACTFNTDGSAGPSASVSPFRAYISLSKNATNAKIIASFEDETETTGIKELLISNDKSPVYDLNGRIVNENVQKSGIYIKNGKKYIK